MRPRPVPFVLALTCFALALVSGRPADAQDDADEVLETGRELYLTGCSSCHGVEGEGVRIVEPGDGIDAEIIDSADGRGQLRGPSLENAGEAGAFYYLSTGRMPLGNYDDQPVRKERAYSWDQIDALVAYVASLGDGPELPEVSITDADVAEGGVVFRANCQACHSAFGSGGALSYGRSAPNLHSSSPAEVAAAVRIGPGQMPRFGPEAMDDETLADLAAYVELLRSPPNEGGLQIGRNGPVPEGFVIWLFGIGGLLLVTAWIGGRSPISSARPDDTDPGHRAGPDPTEPS